MARRHTMDPWATTEPPPLRRRRAAIQELWLAASSTAPLVEEGDPRHRARAHSHRPPERSHRNTSECLHRKIQTPRTRPTMAGLNAAPHVPQPREGRNSAAANLRAAAPACPRWKRRSHRQMRTSVQGRRQAAHDEGAPPPLLSAERALPVGILRRRRVERGRRGETTAAVVARVSPEPPP